MCFVQGDRVGLLVVTMGSELSVVKCSETLGAVHERMHPFHLLGYIDALQPDHLVQDASIALEVALQGYDHQYVMPTHTRTRAASLLTSR